MSGNCELMKIIQAGQLLIVSATDPGWPNGYRSARDRGKVVHIATVWYLACRRDLLWVSNVTSARRQLRGGGCNNPSRSKLTCHLAVFD